MTAEVAVMNHTGVALAADSAVTIGSAAQKIYTSAEKLFQLSEVAPVGIMVYGNAGYVSLPWETTIKAFRKQLGLKTLKTVRDYTNEFVAFLRSNPLLFSESQRLLTMRQLVYSLWFEIRDLRKTELGARRRGQSSPLTPEQKAEIFAKVIEDLKTEVVSEAIIEGAEDFRDRVRDIFDPLVDDAAKGIFGTVDAPADLNARLVDIAIEYLTRRSLRGSASGVVIAGFGDDEYAPVLNWVNLEECVFDLPRCGAVETVAVDHERRSVVMPFAQNDTMAHFLFGVDGGLLDGMTTSVRTMSSGLVDAILDKVGEASPLGDALRDPVKQILNAKLTELFEGWDRLTGEVFMPVVRTIELFQKDELAAVAESFVNLTKFRRRVTPVPETVSGPIDVAVITKGDGFVWIRRKHYFDPNLNPRIMSQFYRQRERL